MALPHNLTAEARDPWELEEGGEWAPPVGAGGYKILIVCYAIIVLF